MPASTYAGNAILNCFLRGVAPTPPSDVFISLHTANPGNSGGGEITIAAWPAYVRRDASAGAGVADAFSPSTAKSSDIAQEVLWPAHNGVANVTITHYAIWDAISGGNCLFYGALTVPKVLQPTDELVVYPEQLTVSVT